MVANAAGAVSRVSPDIVAKFRQDGAVLLKHALGADQMAVVEDAYEYRIQNLTSRSMQPYRGSGATFITDTGSPGIADTAPFKRLWAQTPLLEIAGQIFSTPEVWIFYEQVFLKEGGPEVSAHRTPWHQDLGYDPIEGDDVLRFWITLESVDKAHSLEFVRGSHLGPIYNPSGFDANNEAAPFYKDSAMPLIPDVEADRDAWDILSWAVEPGDVVAFHPQMLHGGAGTPQNRRRRTLSMLLFGRAARFAPRSDQVSTGELGSGGEQLHAYQRSLFEGLPAGAPAHMSACTRLM